MTSTKTGGPLQNIYYERKVATARPCYICKRETTTVLATVKTEDFLYTCDGHLSDAGFATLISAPPATPPGPTADDIKKVVTDYEARQARKAENAKDKDKEKEKDKDKEGEKGKSKDGEGKTEGKPSSSSTLPASIPIASPAQTHKKYALHRQIFEMRKQEIKRKEQTQKAKELGKMIPKVPNGNF